jgi:HCO3- transporter family
MSYIICCLFIRYNWCNGHNFGRHFSFHCRKLDTTVSPLVSIDLTEYAAAISSILFIGLPHVGELVSLDKSTLPVSTSFRPPDPNRTRFFVNLWTLPVGWIFAAIMPGAIITVPFLFDHKVSSIICTIDRYGTK